MNHSSHACLTTRLIHRRDRTETPWWRTVVVCDLPGAFDNDSLTDIEQILPDLADRGFTAILLRPAFADISRSQSALRRLVESAHASGVNVIVRLVSESADQEFSPLDSPPPLPLEHNVDVLTARVRAVKEAGIDGVDLGVIDDSPSQPRASERAETFTQAINTQLAELADLDSTIILAAEATRSNPEFFQRHLTEDWFHHLRDDSLFNSPWNAGEIRRRVTEGFAAHDPLGQTSAWRPSLPNWSGSAGQRISAPGGWKDDADDGRVNAMYLFAASLPGALYLSFLESGGEVDVENGHKPKFSLSLGTDPTHAFRSDLTTQMLALRTEKKLGEGSLAFVDGLEWASENVSVHLSGHVMVVLNTSPDPVCVPLTYQPLLYSQGYIRSQGMNWVLAGNSCAWFSPADPTPVDPAEY